MLRRVDSRCEDACVVLGYPRGSVLAFTQGGVDVQQGQPGSAHTSILHECWRASSRATSHARGHSSTSGLHLLQIPRRLAACGFFKASRLSLLETATPRRSESSLTNELSSQASTHTQGGRKRSASLRPARTPVNTNARIVHLDHRIALKHATRGAPRAPRRHAHATAAPAARRRLAPPPGAAGPDAPFCVLPEDKKTQSLREGRRRGAGRRRRADGVRAGTRQDPSRGRFEED